MCSDVSGLGYILLLNDQPMLYAPDNFIGNRLGSYGQIFEMIVRVEDGELGPGILTETIIRFKCITVFAPCDMPNAYFTTQFCNKFNDTV